MHRARAVKPGKYFAGTVGDQSRYALRDAMAAARIAPQRRELPGWTDAGTTESGAAAMRDEDMLLDAALPCVVISRERCDSEFVRRGVQHQLQTAHMAAVDSARTRPRFIRARRDQGLTGRTMPRHRWTVDYVPSLSRVSVEID